MTLGERGQGLTSETAIVEKVYTSQGTEGLLRLLRNPADPALRAASARALGELYEPEPVEYLVRSFLEDPEPSVRKASRQALEQILADQANGVIQYYRAADRGADTPWLQNGIETNLKPDPQTRWSEKDISSLLFVLGAEKDSTTRIMAIKALSQFSNLHVIENLALTTLFDEDQSVSQAARLALDEIYGDEAESIIESFRLDQESQPDGEIETGDVDRMAAYSAAMSRPIPVQIYPPRSSDYPSIPSVIQEEKPKLGAMVFWFFVVFSIGVLILYILAR